MRPTASWLPALALLLAADAEGDLRARQLPGIRAEAATLIVQGVEGGTLPVAASVLRDRIEEIPSEDGKSRLRLPIAFEVPAASLPGESTTLEIYAYALSTAGAVQAHVAAAVDVTGAQLSDRAGVRILTTLDLPPALYSLRLLALDVRSHRFGLHTEALDLASSKRSLAPPWGEDSCASWITASTAEAPADSGTAGLPVLQIGERTQLLTALSGPSSGSGALVVHLDPSSSSATERQTVAASHRVEAEPATTDRVVRVTFDLPSIPRGVYELSLELRDGGEVLTSPATPAWVIGEADRRGGDDPCDRTWSAVIAHSLSGLDASADTEVAAGTDAPRSDRRAGRGRFLRAYRELLSRLASTGDFDQAAARLGELEQRVFERAAPKALLRAELEAARRLSAREPEVLGPLMMLHHQAYVEHFERNRLALAGHSRRLVSQLAAMSADLHLSEESQLLASDILTSLAELGHRRQTYALSQLLLKDALELSADNRQALLLLAVNYEWFGRYDEAGELLQHLVDVAATHHEGRLRLGIMRQRAGDHDQAEALFRQLLRERPRPWLLSLTYQALGELLLEQERYDEAVELLTRGRKRLRGDQRLELLSAYALERAGQATEGSRLLAELSIEGSTRTPRFRYGESLTGPLESMRESIDRGIAVRMPLLARAVGATSALEVSP